MIPKIGTQRTSVWSKLTTLRETPKGCAGDLILNLVTARQGVIKQETYARPQHSSQSGTLPRSLR
jgi:hypothetical protein